MEKKRYNNHCQCECKRTIKQVCKEDQRWNICCIMIKWMLLNLFILVGV